MNKNVNRLNQNNNYGHQLKKIAKEYSSLHMGNTVAGTGDMGKLIPIHLHELIPSQAITLEQTAGIQFNPFVTNLFHEIYLEMLYYFVPYRLLDENWEEFITGGIDGTYNAPIKQMEVLHDHNLGKGLIGTLADYFGMPIGNANADKNSAEVKPIIYPWAAYNKIYNDHIRIPDIEPNEIDLESNEVQRGNWDWDYFTRSRVYQQRGVTPSIPISDEMMQLEHEWEIKGTHPDTEIHIAENNIYKQINTKLRSKDNPKDKNTFYTQSTKYDKDRPHIITETKEFTAQILPHSLSALGMDMNDFLLGLAIQRMQINNAKIDTRYIDHLQVRFGVYPQDARLQRAEYLGSEYVRIATDTVTNTGSEQEQGRITGQASGVGNGKRIRYEAQEHGVLMTLAIVKPKPAYEGGLDKMWTKQTRFDFPTPELANLPDVPVYQYELCYNPQKDEANKKVFGWQGIYEEYRTLTNKICGRLRPSINDNLKTMTLARYWNPINPPILNKEFIQCNPDQERILQYMDEPAFMYFIRNEIDTALPLPIQSMPGELPYI